MKEKDKKPLDPYEILGLKPGATKEEIKAAYKAKVLKCHPDKNLDDPTKTNAEFLQLSEAYQNLIAREKVSDKTRELIEAIKQHKTEQACLFQNLINDFDAFQQTIQGIADLRALFEELEKFGSFKEFGQWLYKAVFENYPADRLRSLIAMQIDVEEIANILKLEERQKNDLLMKFFPVRENTQSKRKKKI